MLVTSINLTGNGTDDITGVCQPFWLSTTPGPATTIIPWLDNATLVAFQLDQVVANASLADIHDIRNKEKVKIAARPSPSQPHIAALCGFSPHPFPRAGGGSNTFVRCIWLLANNSSFSEHLPYYLTQHQALILGMPWAEVYPAPGPCPPCHVQINSMHEHLQALQVGAVTPEPPSFLELLRDLQKGSFHMSSSWLPFLPTSVTVPPTIPTGRAAAPSPSTCTHTTRASTATSTSELATATGGGHTATGTGVPIAAPPGRIWQIRRAMMLSLTPCNYALRCQTLLRAHQPTANKLYARSNQFLLD